MKKKPGGAAATDAETPEAESTEEFTESDAEAAFAEGLGEPASDTPEETIPPEGGTPEGSETTDETGPKGAAAPAEQKASGTETPGEDKGEGDLSHPKPTYDELKKQLEDTKAWGTQLSQTVADLKKQVESKPPDKPDKTDKPGEIEIPDDIKQYLSDYPEAKKAIDFFAEQLMKKTLGDLDPKSIQETITGMQDQLSQANFEKAVVSGFMSNEGKWIDGHPDAYKIMATEDYSTWFQSELKRDPTISDISDPSKAIEVLTRFKAHKASSAAAAHDADLGGNLAKDVKDIAAGAVQPGTHQSSEAKPTDEDKSPEEIFEEHAT